MNDFTMFKNRYYITGEIVTLTPLRVGAGSSIEPSSTDMPVLKTFSGIPYIPGSTLKGVIRANFERILNTLAANKIKIENKYLRACNFLSDKENCLSDLEIQSKDEREITKLIFEKDCTACSLFGSSLLASRIYFMDAYLSEQYNRVKTEIRDGVAIDRDTGTAKEKAKFDYEVIPPGVSFKLEVFMENVETWEVAFIILVLKFLDKGDFSLGGRSSTGLGRVNIRNLKIEKVEGTKLLDYILTGKKELVDQSNLINELTSLLKGGVNA